MPGRNLAKPFAIAAFILAEIYMLFTVLAPYSRETHPLPFPIPEAPALAPGTPPSTGDKVLRCAVSALFFGPFGALAGAGVGLIVSGLLGDFRQPASESRKSGPPV